jgi:hypothetical protein
MSKITKGCVEVVPISPELCFWEDCEAPATHRVFIDIEAITLYARLEFFCRDHAAAAADVIREGLPA